MSRPQRAHRVMSTPAAASNASSKTHTPAMVKKALLGWFTGRGWRPFAFQRDVWKAVHKGESGLLHATTGAGKTYAVWLAALQAFAFRRSAKSGSAAPPLTVLWLTPMRALAADTVRALPAPLEALAGACPGRPPGPWAPAPAIPRAVSAAPRRAASRPSWSPRPKA